MEAILSLLEKLLPLWAAAMVVGFGYLLVLLKRASESFVTIANRQVEYMKDRVDMVDKSTGIFARTIDQQEKEIRALEEKLARIGANIQSTRETDARLSVQELQLLSRSVAELTARQDAVLASVAKPETGLLIELAHESADVNLQRGIERAIRARDLSIYPVSVANVANAKGLVDHLRDAGYAAYCYEDDEDVALPEDDAEAIWLGAMVPPANAIEVMRIALRHSPRLKYVHLSTDSSGPEETHYTLFIGGSSESAKGFLGCLPWSQGDFDLLSPTMSFEAFHQFIRERYRMDVWPPVEITGLLPNEQRPDSYH